MRFYLFEEETIIASKNKVEAESLYQETYDNDYTDVKEIDSDYVVSANESVHSSNGGYNEVTLRQIVDKHRELPFIVDIDEN
jgi:hypothetical protein